MVVKITIENEQNLIVEGCYIPFDWAKDFDLKFLDHIKYYCLVMIPEYIRNHFDRIKKYANVIERRQDDEDCTLKSVLEDNRQTLELVREYDLNCILIDNKYEVDIDIKG